MSLRISLWTDFVKWLGPVLDVLRALGGYARHIEITIHNAETWKTCSSKMHLQFLKYKSKRI